MRSRLLTAAEITVEQLLHQTEGRRPGSGAHHSLRRLYLGLKLKGRAEAVTWPWPLGGDRAARGALGSPESCSSETKRSVFPGEGQAWLRGSKKPTISGPDEPTGAVGIKEMESEGLGKTGCDSRFQTFKWKSELRFVLKGSREQDKDT